MKTTRQLLSGDVAFRSSLPPEARLRFLLQNHVVANDVGQHNLCLHRADAHGKKCTNGTDEFRDYFHFFILNYPNFPNIPNFPKNPSSRFNPYTITFVFRYFSRKAVGLQPFRFLNRRLKLLSVLNPQV